MAAPVFGSSATGAGTASVNLTVPPRADNDLIFAWVCQSGASATSAFSAADNSVGGSNTYIAGPVWRSSGSRAIFSFYCLVPPGKGTSGGGADLTLTITRTVSTPAWAATALWVSPPAGATLAYVDDDGFANPSGTTWYCADTPGIDVPADAISLVAWQTEALPGSLTLPSGYTSISAPNTLASTAYRTTTSALPGERPAYTGTTARAAVGAMFAFKTVSAAGGGGPFPHHTRRALAGGMQYPRGGIL